MVVKFFARGSALQPMPAAQAMAGSPPRYVGRKFVAGDGKERGASHPATREGTAVDVSTKAGAKLAASLRKALVAGDIGADAAAFEHLNMVPLRLEWVSEAYGYQLPAPVTHKKGSK